MHIVSAHLGGRGDRAEFFCAETTENFRVASVLGGVFGTRLESLNPNGLVVSASQPAKCLVEQKEIWRPQRNGSPVKDLPPPSVLNGCSRI